VLAALALVGTLKIWRTANNHAHRHAGSMPINAFKRDFHLSIFAVEPRC